MINTSSKNILFFIIKCMFLFFYVYSLSIEGLPPQISTERVVVFVLAFYRIFFELKSNHEKKIKTIADHYFDYFVFFQLFLLLYTIILFVFVGRGSGDLILNSIINFLCFGVLAYWGFSFLFKSFHEFLTALLVISIFQSIVVLFGMLSPKFVQLLYRYNGNRSFWNYEVMANGGYHVGLACITSTGALKLSLGYIPCVYDLITRKKHFLPIVIFFILLTFSATAVARTGLFISFVALFFIFFFKARNNGFRKFYIFLVFSLLLSAGIWVIRYFGLSSQLIVQFSRLNSLIEKGSQSFFDAYFWGDTTVIPRISWKTILGTGIVSGTSGNGVTINADGGFIKTYCALGLPMAILYYGFILYLLLKMTLKDKLKEVKWVSIFMIIVLIMGEFKEFFFYMRFYLVCFFIFQKSAEDRNT